jgi:hypothetical protein
MARGLAANGSIARIIAEPLHSTRFLGKNSWKFNLVESTSRGANFPSLEDHVAAW